MHNIYHFICEGKSEYAYIQLVNRFLHNEGIPILLKPHNAHGGKTKNIKSSLNDIRKSNRGSIAICALLDLDIYFREDDDILKLPDTVVYLFNSWNFEDFLVMHYNDPIISQWKTSCCTSGHAKIPEHSTQIISRLQSNIFPAYKKGSLPDDFIIDWETLYNLFRNNKKNKRFLLSDFAYFFKNLLCQYYSS